MQRLRGSDRVYFHDGVSREGNKLINLRAFLNEKRVKEIFHTVIQGVSFIVITRAMWIATVSRYCSFTTDVGVNYESFIDK